MKKIIKPIVKDAIILAPETEFPFEKFYGVDICGERGFITRHDYNKGLFFVIAGNTMTNGNGWGNAFAGDSIFEVVNTILSEDARYEVFVFDTFIELMKWVSEG